MADVASMRNSAGPFSAAVNGADATVAASTHSPTTSSTATTATTATPARRFSMIDVDNDQRELPSVQELLAVVKLLQGAVRDVGPHASDSSTALFEDDESSFATYRSPSRAPRYYIDPRNSLKHHASPSLGIYDPRRRGNSVVSAHSPQRDDAFRRSGNGSGDPYAASGLITPPPKRRDSHYAARGQSSVPRPATRVAALTRENISLLPTPQDLARRRNTAGSIVSGTSQQSKMSARTDGGAVFSRLYQSDYHKTREQKLRAIRDRQETLAFQFSTAGTPSYNKRLSISSVDSLGSSIGSMQSAKTDITGVSSRLYDPDYVKKRNARLARMREEREMRDCTFVPTINTSSTTAQPAVGRRASSAHQIQRP